jgi:hypothetical protein
MTNSQNKVQILMEISSEKLNLLSHDLKRLFDSLDKACTHGVYCLKESQMICTSLENFEQFFMSIAHSVNQTIDKAEKAKLQLKETSKEVIKETINNNSAK